MALDFLRLGDCAFYGPALPEPYVRFELEKALTKHKLLPDVDGLTGQALRDDWDVFRRKLRDVSPNSGPLAITHRILEPLVARLGYAKLAPADAVLTREGDEAGGVLLSADTGAKLRCWAIDYDADLDAPTQRGYAYRFSPVRIAQRVLLAAGERVGLITNGVELRLLLCDPARPESHIEIDLNVWRRSRDLPDGYQLLLALAGPAGVAALPEIIEDARLKQNKVTKELRVQARRAVEEFVQAVLDHPDNGTALAGHSDKAALAKALWHEGLIVVYRLLFILKCESTSDPSRVFRFASTPLWRNTYSPSTALARTVRRVLDEGATSGRFLEDGLRVLFRLFAEGLEHPGLTVRPLGGALFGAQSTPLLSSLCWGELAVAHLLNRLLWSDTRRGRERVHYGPLDVEDLGRVYEALLELEPGIATEPMCRLRRQKLEVVVPAAQGEKYRAPTLSPGTSGEGRGEGPAEATDESDGDDDQPEEEQEPADEDKPARGKKTKVEWIEAIASGRFYLRVGLGRKSSGSYYTPHSFVRFLVQETLGPQCDQRSPRDNPDPGALLKLKVLDPACGSGHFLVEACRFLAGRVYEAARLCDELATKAEHDAEAEKNAARKQGLLDRAAELRQRLRDLPDQEDELLSYLPSRSAGADRAVLSAHDIARAEAICRRLVAVHCIYGVDLNPLAVELARLSLWIESHAEGYPLTFLDHRIVVGNSLTGPFWDKLVFYPGSQQPVKDLFRQNLDLKLAARLREALTLVRRLEASVGVDVEDIAAKEKLKREIDARLQPFRVLAAAWSGGVMLGTDQPKGAPRCDDAAYSDLLEHVGNTGELPASIDSPNLQAMIDKGRLALPYDLTFPEVFHPTGLPHGRHGFDAVAGNPPWDVPESNLFEIVSVVDPSIPRSKAKVQSIEARAREVLEPKAFGEVSAELAERRATNGLVVWLNDPKSLATGKTDTFCFFARRAVDSARVGGRVGLVGPGSFHLTEATAVARDALIQDSRLRVLLNFDNLKRLFADLPQVVRFDILVADSHTSASRTEVAAIFNASDDHLLQTGPFLSYPYGLASGDGDPREPLPAFEHARDAEVFSQLATLARVGVWLEKAKVDFHQEINVSTFGPAFEVVRAEKDYSVPDPRTPAALELLSRDSRVLLYESKCFHQFDPLWTESVGSKWDPWPTLACHLLGETDMEQKLAEKIGQRTLYFRAVVRASVGNKATIERSCATCILPPYTSCVHSGLIERAPWERPTTNSLLFVAIGNSFALDYQVRLRMAANITKGVIDRCAWPEVSAARVMLVHSCLRLSAPNRLYEPLWREQLGDAWRESGKAPFTWPVLAGDDERWAVRAAIDAVVAGAYGLSREQYAHVLSTFSHASYKQAPELCLEAFDELKAIGLDAFCKKHDPYHDIPLVETLPKPVIDLPIPAEAEGRQAAGGRRATGARRRPGRSEGPSLFDAPISTPEAPSTAARGKATALPGPQLAVQTLLELRKVLTSAEVQDQFGLDAAAARAILKGLVERGLASVEGKAKGTRYRWSGN